MCKKVTLALLRSMSLIAGCVLFCPSAYAEELWCYIYPPGIEYRVHYTLTADQTTIPVGGVATLTITLFGAIPPECTPPASPAHRLFIHHFDYPYGNVPASEMEPYVSDEIRTVVFHVYNQNTTTTARTTDVTFYDPNAWICCLASDYPTVTLTLLGRPPTHTSYTGAFSVQPQPVTGGTGLSVGVTLSSPAESGMAVNVGSPCSNGDFLYAAPNTNPTLFPAGLRTQTYSFIAHVYSQPSTITCSPYYSWPESPQQHLTLGSYQVQINPPQLLLSAPATAPGGTVHFQVSLTPANQYDVPFELISSVPNVIPNSSGILTIGGTASFDLTVTPQQGVDSVVLTARILTPTGYLQTSTTVVINDLDLLVGTGSGPTDPTTASKPVSDTITARIPLGSVFFVQLARKDANGVHTPLETSFGLSAAAISPAITEPTLFPSDVVIVFGPAAPTNLKFFQAMHRGTVDLFITPTDESTGPVRVTLSVIPPDSLGTANNTWDPTIISLAHRFGIPPQFLKGQVSKESDFNPRKYRYEVLTIDPYQVSGGNQQRTQTPYSLYRLATSDGLTQGTGLRIPDDIEPRRRFTIVRNNVARQIADTDQFVTASEIYTNNDSTGSRENWTVNTSQRRLQDLFRNPNALDFTAQTTLASSYGLMQTLYGLAVGDLNWTGINGGRNPSYLFDTPTNLAQGGGSLPLGATYLRISFTRANRGLSLQLHNPNSPSTLQRAFIKAFNYYNGSGASTTARYGTDAMARASSFLPRTATPIF